MQKCGLFLFLGILLIGFSGIASGVEVPNLINYEGTLSGTNGDPVPDGGYDVTFNIYETPTGGAAVWSETWDAGTSQVIAFGGHYNVLLGAYNPFPDNFFVDHPVTYFGITVGQDSEMLPRQRITSAAYALNAENGVPEGVIVMWSGELNEIPEGWSLCDGSNGTPDLRDRFIVGAGSTYAKGATGGEATHTLTINEMPSHTHIQNAHSHTMQVGKNGDKGNEGSSTLRSYGDWTPFITDNKTATNQNTGGDQPHNNLPPYYALAYIMKL